ncbi:hypothetical protein OG21DRAFT_530348 [Imleria badia]|nr:hypothetical protein OG21DRAFT_530348 [Imleria badia]
MSFSPHEVYSRYLVGPEGYPLWTPQLKAELPEDYQREGLKIGDVGHVLPRNGSFDVLFNITLPRNQQPDPKLVREGFRPVILDQADFATQHDAVSVHGVIPRASVELTSKHVDTGRDQTPSRADYEFSMSMEDGAVLILPEGAQSRDLQNEKRFLDEAIRHAVDWYECATEEGGRLISNDSLYLITGFHKAHSWSLGAAGRSVSSLHEQRSAKFKVGQIHEGGLTAEAYSWEATHGFEGRVGPMHPYQLPNHILSGGIRGGVPNQTVFIRGFRITVNKILFLKTVSVKAGQNTHFKFTGFGSNMFNLLWGGTAEPTSSSGAESSTDNTVDQDSSVNRSRLDTDTRVTIDHMPSVSQTFHPGDLINQYMLKKEPRAMIAITHDSLWIEMLRMEILEPAAFSHENRLQDVLQKYYRMMIEDGAVYTQRVTPHGHSSIPNWSRTTSMDNYASRIVETATLQAQAESTTRSYCQNC